MRSPGFFASSRACHHPGPRPGELRSRTRVYKRHVYDRQRHIESSPLSWPQAPLLVAAEAEAPQIGVREPPERQVSAATSPGLLSHSEGSQATNVTFEMRRAHERHVYVSTRCHGRRGLREGSHGLCVDVGSRGDRHSPTGCPRCERCGAERCGGGPGHHGCPRCGLRTSCTPHASHPSTPPRGLPPAMLPAPPKVGVHMKHLEPCPSCRKRCPGLCKPCMTGLTQHSYKYYNPKP